MPDTPLNPDALDNLATVVFGFDIEEWNEHDEDEKRQLLAPYVRTIETYLAAALPEVTTFEESDALPVGSVVLDVDGNTARRFPDGWRTTVVEADGRVWLSGHMEDPDLPARVLYRPEVKP